MRDLYDDAEIYAAAHADVTEDLPFYRNCAAVSGGPVLEIGCGTGRVALDLVAAGFPVVGVDSSASALAYAVAHARGITGEGRFEAVDADARKLDLGRRFPLILLPLNFLAHFAEESDVKEIFAAVRRHLQPGGRAVCHIFPGGSGVATGLLSFRGSFSVSTDADEHTLVEWYESRSVFDDPPREELSWYFIGDHETVRRDLKLRIRRPDEIARCAHHSGLCLTEERSSFSSDADSARRSDWIGTFRRDED